MVVLLLLGCLHLSLDQLHLFQEKLLRGVVGLFLLCLLLRCGSILQDEHFLLELLQHAFLLLDHSTVALLDSGKVVFLEFGQVSSGGSLF